MTDIHDLEKKAMCGDTSAIIAVVSERRTLDGELKLLKRMLGGYFNAMYEGRTKNAKVFIDEIGELVDWTPPVREGTDADIQE